jgi:hypothetical protein
VQGVRGLHVGQWLSGNSRREAGVARDTDHEIPAGNKGQAFQRTKHGAVAYHLPRTMRKVRGRKHAATEVEADWARRPQRPGKAARHWLGAARWPVG